MEKILPNQVVGALAGFGIGVLAAMSLVLVGLPARLFEIPVGILGAIAGWVVGTYLRRPAEQGGTIARWCACMTLAVGAISFLAGFVGPILLHPDSPQGPLLGFFLTGPLGAVAGALLGLAIGVARTGFHSAKVARVHSTQPPLRQ
jgi:hypothetical protein